jgi:hypothetical protein
VKKQQRSGHSYIALVCGLSIPLALFSTWLAGYVSLVCERAYIEAWFSTFDEHWQAPKGYRYYRWFHYLSNVPSVLSRPERKVYQKEKVKDREERVNTFIDKWVESVIHTMTSTFGLIAALMAVAWVKLCAPVARRYQLGVFRKH